MIKITMFSSADKVAGQGVGSAYVELLQLLKNYHSSTLLVSINRYTKTQISHYHTIDPIFFISTFFKHHFGRRIGYVHFLPSTLKGSLQLPRWVTVLFYWYVIAFYKRMDQLVVVNPSYITELMKYGIPEETITYIPNFVSKKDFYSLEPHQVNQIKTSLGLKEKRFIVFGAGQVQERKGVMDFIKLAEAMPDIQFIWAGGFSFGKLTDGYEKLKQKMEHPPKNLLFTGIVGRKEMLRYYNIADVFLLPSYDELFPMCILEAFSCGTPVVLRDLALYLPVLEGYYLPAANREAMQGEIERLANDAAYYQAALQKTTAGNNTYSEERLAQIWGDFYQQQEKKNEQR
ncbi:glycosyltransferase family 4 protein [Carnobacterium sp.]|uniref:glycosyltransferase family 4 protein n=1 Tax=Carnobacterium sp. TaxID=48221 RepID=UPI0028B002EF|nr:glycosyltransferase family 4 protein [Carnobacterium sp.]